MKTGICCIAMVLVSWHGSHAQATKTIVLQPDSCGGYDAVIGGCAPCGFTTKNYGSADEISAIAWTFSSNLSIARSLLRFDLTAVPTTAVVTNAALSLYQNPNPASGNMNGQHSTLSGSNESYLRPITGAWGEHTVTWATQPATSTAGQVLLPASTSGNQDYLNINVTSMVQAMVADPSQNFGFMLQLADESYYRGLLFASSDHPNAALHPKLEITYVDTAATTCMVFQPGNDCGEGTDADIGDCVPCGYFNQNYGSVDELSAIAWTFSGNPSDVRGLIRFDLAAIPANAVVASAELSLYQNPNPASGNMQGQHSTQSGSNATYLRRITAMWSESTVTWATQPATTTTNEVLLPASTSGNQDYLNIDVKALVQDMVSNPAQNFGLMMQLATETAYRGLLFASSDHPDAALHPKLEVCFALPVGLSHASQGRPRATVSPNPSQGTFFVQLDNTTSAGNLVVLDAVGRQVLAAHLFPGQNAVRLNASPGIYLFMIREDKALFTEKVVVE